MRQSERICCRVSSENYTGFNDTLTVNVNKGTPKISAKKKTNKAGKKVKKYAVKLKSGKTPIRKAKLTLKINGKKYKAKTNNKGKATFKITRLTKKGSFKAKVSYKGDANYKKAVGKAKIKIK